MRSTSHELTVVTFVVLSLSIAAVGVAGANARSNSLDAERSTVEERLLGVQPKAQLTTAALAKKASPSLVTITSAGGQGSGVVVDSSGVLVTNLHVVRGQTRVMVKLANGDVYDDVVVVDVDDRRDLVLLKIKAFGLAPAVLGNSDQVQIGDRVVLIGSPKGLDVSVSDGLISAIRDNGNGSRVFQTSAAASPGSSGGGMFNAAGELIGIVSSKLTAGENLNFAVPSNYLRGLLTTQTRMSLSELAKQFPAESVAQASPAGPATSQATSAVQASATAALVAATGLDWKKNSDTSWSTDYKGKSLETVTVSVVIAEDIILVASFVPTPPNLTPQQVRSLFTASLDVTLASYYLTDKGVLATANQTELRLLDAAGLKRIVESVALGADNASRLLTNVVTETPAPGLTAPPNVRGFVAVPILQGHASLRYDPKQWVYEKEAVEGDWMLNGKDGDLWVKVITERTEIPASKMPEIALTNAKRVDPAAKITKQGSRTVNGLPMTYVEYEATIQGVPVSFYAHFYSDSSVTVQIIGYTGRNLLLGYRSAIEQVVSGFSIQTANSMTERKIPAP